MDREEIIGLVGQRVVVGLNREEGGGAEIYAKLDEMRDDGIVLSDIAELGEGPILFCPWDTFRRVHDRPPWFMPPREGSGQQEELQVREQIEPGGLPEDENLWDSMLDRREPSARTLERVVPVAQRAVVDHVTVAIASLEIYGEGMGTLRWLISFEESSSPGVEETGFFEPVFEIRDEGGRILSWSPSGASASDGEANGETLLEDLPETGELEVTVARLVSDACEGREYRGEEPAFEGPWNFRFTL